MKIFKLPDLGEGLTDAEIVNWHVKIGDTVQVDQILVSMETAKAIVEVPTPFSGKVLKLYGNAGDIIKTGDPLIEFENGEASGTAGGSEGGTVVGKLEVGNTIIHEEASPLTTTAFSHAQEGAKATPAVRALAKQLKVELGALVPTGPNATITSQDVELAAKNLQAAGPIQLLKGVRRAMAETMSRSHSEVVPVTVMEDAKLLKWSETEDITVRLIQALVRACKEEPALNAWYDGQSKGRRLIPEVHLGIAMDTEDGLFVPVMHSAEKLEATEMRKRLDVMKAVVQNRTVTPHDLRGATIILSNFGKFGGRYSTPIIVPPMVAILGVGNLREEVVAIEHTSKITSILPLSLTFDHRVITGGEATRFLAVVIQSLEQ